MKQRDKTLPIEKRMKKTPRGGILTSKQLTPLQSGQVPKAGVNPLRIVKKEMHDRRWDREDMFYRTRVLDKPKMKRLLSQFLRGEEMMDERIAAMLQNAFAVPKELWIKLEADYRKKKLEKEQSNE